MTKLIVLAVLLAVAAQEAFAEEISRNPIGAELAGDNRAGAQDDFSMTDILLAPIDADLDTESESSQSNEVSSCPSTCKCLSGSATDGFGKNVNPAGYCTHMCSKPYSGRRFCGSGHEGYEGAGSIDCKACGPPQPPRKACPSHCRCSNGDVMNGGLYVPLDGYCTERCSRLYGNHGGAPGRRFCGKGAAYQDHEGCVRGEEEEACSFDCTGCAPAHPPWYADTLCLPGGTNNKNQYTLQNQQACAFLSEEQCVASRDCTFHSSCETSLPLTAVLAHRKEEFFEEFPHLRGENFTCSCDEALQDFQIQQFLAQLNVKGPTNSCQAHNRKIYKKNHKFCQSLKTVEECMAHSEICKDPYADQRREHDGFVEKHAAKLVAVLKSCAAQKCAACNAAGKSPDKSQSVLLVEEDAGTGFGGGNCGYSSGWGRRRLR